MINAILTRIIGSRNERTLKGIRPLVSRCNELEPSVQRLSDPELVAKTAEFRGRLARGEPLDDLLPEAFAVVREAGKRTLGMRHFDVQIVGGIVLHRGKIAEMKTGEGKTLVATLPVYLNALTGLHLGDRALVQDGAADQLDVEMAHAQRALGGLAHAREGLGQDVVEILALGEALAELRRLGAERVVGELLDRRLPRRRFLGDELEAAQQATFAGSEQLVQKVDHGPLWEGGSPPQRATGARGAPEGTVAVGTCAPRVRGRPADQPGTGSITPRLPSRRR